MTTNIKIMIEVNELRLGNYIYKLGNVMQVENETFRNVSAMLFPYDPIPITEEWLLNFGFEKVPDGWYMFGEKDDIKFDISYITDCVIYFYCCGRTRTLKYVHQVQNLYIALTGEELTLSVT